MGVDVHQSQDCLTDLFSTNSITPPHRERKPTPNRRRRTPPRHQPAPPPSPPVCSFSPKESFLPKGSKKKNLNHNNNNSTVSNHVRILKRGEEIGKKIPDLTVEKSDLKSTHQIGSDPVMIPTQTRISDRKPTSASFYAGPVTSTSPPPSEVPLPAFFSKKSVSVVKPADATNDLIRILRLDID